MFWFFEDVGPFLKVHSSHRDQWWVHFCGGYYLSKILTWDIHDFPLSLIDFWAQSCWNSQLWMKVRYMVFFYGNRIWLIWPIGNEWYMYFFSVFNTHSLAHAVWPECELVTQIIEFEIWNFIEFSNRKNYSIFNYACTLRLTITKSHP